MQTVTSEWHLVSLTPLNSKGTGHHLIIYAQIIIMDTTHLQWTGNGNFLIQSRHGFNFPCCTYLSLLLPMSILLFCFCIRRWLCPFAVSTIILTLSCSLCQSLCLCLSVYTCLCSLFFPASTLVLCLELSFSHPSRHCFSSWPQSICGGLNPVSSSAVLLSCCILCSVWTRCLVKICFSWTLFSLCYTQKHTSMVLAKLLQLCVDDAGLFISLRKSVSQLQ